MSIIDLIRVPEGKDRENGEYVMFKEIVVENYPELIKRRKKQKNKTVLRFRKTTAQWKPEDSKTVPSKC